MLRFLALTAVLFVVPFAIHSAWIIIARRRMPEREDFPTGRIVAFSIVGALLVLVGVVWLALSEGGLTGDGQPVPATTETNAG